MQLTGALLLRMITEALIGWHASSSNSYQPVGLEYQLHDCDNASGCLVR
jgi:hypothetical protein